MSECNFDKYIRRASCNMNECPYGYDLDCRECTKRMIAEHDAKIRADAIDAFVHEVKSNWMFRGESGVPYRDAMYAIAKRMKEQKE